ncbi:MAG: hypothetical protein JWN25_1182 [Verrucomicrobiales bacterium]|nr:hypothetical protein [Verrucomicrobiales bacterium]
MDLAGSEELDVHLRLSVIVLARKNDQRCQTAALAVWDLGGRLGLISGNDRQSDFSRCGFPDVCFA